MSDSDSILSIPRWLLEEADTRRFAAFALPLAVPDYVYSVIWRKRTQGDPSLRWLRDGLAAMFTAN